MSNTLLPFYQSFFEWILETIVDFLMEPPIFYITCMIICLAVVRIFKELIL